MPFQLLSRFSALVWHKCLTRGVIALMVAVCFGFVSLAASVTVLTLGGNASSPWEELTNLSETIFEVEQRVCHECNRQLARIPRRFSMTRIGDHYTQYAFSTPPVRPFLIGSGIAMLC